MKYLKFLVLITLGVVTASHIDELDDEQVDLYDSLDDESELGSVHEDNIGSPIPLGWHDNLEEFRADVPAEESSKSVVSEPPISEKQTRLSCPFSGEGCRFKKAKCTCESKDSKFKFVMKKFSTIDDGTENDSYTDSEVSDVSSVDEENSFLPDEDSTDLPDEKAHGLPVTEGPAEVPIIEEVSEHPTQTEIMKEIPTVVQGFESIEKAKDPKPIFEGTPGSFVQAEGSSQQTGDPENFEDKTIRIKTGDLNDSNKKVHEYEYLRVKKLDENGVEEQHMETPETQNPSVSYHKGVMESADLSLKSRLNNLVPTTGTTTDESSGPSKSTPESASKSAAIPMGWYPEQPGAPESTGSSPIPLGWHDNLEEFRAGVPVTQQKTSSAPIALGWHPEQPKVEEDSKPAPIPLGWYPDHPGASLKPSKPAPIALGWYGDQLQNKIENSENVQNELLEMKKLKEELASKRELAALAASHGVPTSGINGTLEFSPELKRYFASSDELAIRKADEDRRRLGLIPSDYNAVVPYNPSVSNGLRGVEPSRSLKSKKRRKAKKDKKRKVKKTKEEKKAEKKRKKADKQKRKEEKKRKKAMKSKSRKIDEVSEKKELSKLERMREQEKLLDEKLDKLSEDLEEKQVSARQRARQVKSLQMKKEQQQRMIENAENKIKMKREQRKKLDAKERLDRIKKEKSLLKEQEEEINQISKDTEEDVKLFTGNTADDDE